MSCGQDHCTCDHDTDAAEVATDRQLPTVGQGQPTERASGCCGGKGHAE